MIGERTPGPWGVLVQATNRIGRSPSGQDWVAKIVEGNSDVAEIFGFSEVEAHGKAAFIVQACNSYEPNQQATRELVGALKKLCGKIDPACLVEDDLRHSDLADELRLGLDALAKHGG